MIKDLIKYKESERKSVKDVLLRNKYFQPEGYQIYDHPEAEKPGLCVIITQAKYHDVIINGKVNTINFFYYHLLYEFEA